MWLFLSGSCEGGCGGDAHEGKGACCSWASKEYATMVRTASPGGRANSALCKLDDDGRANSLTCRPRAKHAVAKSAVKKILLMAATREPGVLVSWWSAQQAVLASRPIAAALTVLVLQQHSLTVEAHTHVGLSPITIVVVYRVTEHTGPAASTSHDSWHFNARNSWAPIDFGTYMMAI
jgi:hypothetical protein